MQEQENRSFAKTSSCGRLRGDWLAMAGREEPWDPTGRWPPFMTASNVIRCQTLRLVSQCPEKAQTGRSEGNTMTGAMNVQRHAAHGNDSRCNTDCMSALRALGDVDETSQTTGGSSAWAPGASLPAACSLFSNASHCQQCVSCLGRRTRSISHRCLRFVLHENAKKA